MEYVALTMAMTTTVDNQTLMFRERVLIIISILFFPMKWKEGKIKLKASCSQFIHVMAYVCIDFLDLFNRGIVEFGLCELSRLLEKNFFILGQLCDKKTCAFVVMGIGKKVVWAGSGRGRGH